MIATVVTGSQNAMQVFALIAVILFAIGGIIALLEKSVYTVLICAGLVCVALSLLFFP